MKNDYKGAAVKKYLRYFAIWFVLTGIALVICVGVLTARERESRRTRTNFNAPEERVYDYAEVLNAEQEESLRQMIAVAEQKYKIDIVLVTTNQAMEGEEAKAAYNYRSTDWEQNMQDTADDFWDENKYGFNKGFEGDGALLLSNWYEGQCGEHLSTSGIVEQKFSMYDINHLLDEVGRYIESDPYKAYQVYVETLCRGAADGTPSDGGAKRIFGAVGLSTIVALFYFLTNSKRKQAENTTTTTTYVVGGEPIMNNQEDTFLGKNVTKRKIETSSGGSSGGSRSGGGGHHHSSSGASHGGGSRRR